MVRVVFDSRLMTFKLKKPMTNDANDFDGSRKEPADG